MTELQIGRRFIHANWLDTDYTTPLTCQITQINAEVVYYRSIYKDGTIGSSMHETIERFPERVKEWL